MQNNSMTNSEASTLLTQEKMQNSSRTDFEAPAPYLLALASKEEMTTLSVRIKKHTSEYFNYIAQRFRTTPSALINALLDDYVAKRSDAEFESYARQRQVSTLLKSQVDELAAMDAEAVFKADGWLDWYYDVREDGAVGEDEDPRKKWQEFEVNIPDGGYDEFVFRTIYIRGEVEIELAPARVDHIKTFDEPLAADSNYGVCVPYKKWLMLDAVLQRAMEIHNQFIAHRQCNGSRADYDHDYSYTDTDLALLLSAVDETPIDDPRVFVAKLVECITNIWQGIKQPDYPNLDIELTSLINKGTFLPLRYKSPSLGKGFHGDLLTLNESRDATGLKPLRVEIIDKDGKIHQKELNSWIDLTQVVLDFIAQENRGVIAKNFHTNKQDLRVPRQIQDTLYYFESNKNSNDLGNLAIRIAREAQIQKLTITIDY